MILGQETLYGHKVDEIRRSELRQIKKVAWVKPTKYLNHMKFYILKRVADIWIIFPLLSSLSLRVLRATLMTLVSFIPILASILAFVSSSYIIETNDPLSNIFTVAVDFVRSRTDWLDMLWILQSFSLHCSSSMLVLRSNRPKLFTIYDRIIN
jgi:hypothetical protein